MATCSRRSLAGIALVSLLILGTERLSAQPVPAEDEGYFLSWRQKGQLVGWGCIQDSTGHWYDVWICPGYSNPATYGWEHLQKSGRHFREYTQASKYQRLAENSSDCFEWAFKDCGHDFMLKGIPKAWARYLDKAEERTRRRVFGSVVAYPWAVMEGTFDTTFRLVGGLCGIVGGTAAGAVAVPAWHALDSGVAGSAVFVGQGVILPVAGWTWNTVAAPTLAMIGGPRPAPARADGFWVRMVDDKGRVRTSLSREQLAAAVAWGVLMLTEVQPGSERSDELTKETEQKIAALREEMTRELQRLHDETERRVTQLREGSGFPSATPAALRRHAAQIEQALQQDRTISQDDARKIMGLLRRYPPPLPPPAPTPAEKTDPLRRGIDILQDVSR
jgi:hypothetical protein